MSATVVWFTGLSGSGKTTIADAAEAALRQRNKRVLVLDGDDIRNMTHRHLNFSPAEIRENNRLIADMCRNALPDYDVILVPIISPFKDSRLSVRTSLEDVFVEVYVQASLNVVIERDPKGLYRKALQGELSGFIGLDSSVPYEPPDSPEVVLDTETCDIESCVDSLVQFILAKECSSSVSLGRAPEKR